MTKPRRRRAQREPDWAAIMQDVIDAINRRHARTRRRALVAPVPARSCKHWNEGDLVSSVDGRGTGPTYSYSSGGRLSRIEPPAPRRRKKPHGRAQLSQ